MSSVTELKKVTDVIGRPSQALRSMADGLLKAAKRKTFQIRMYTFGHFRNGICYGCAATCAVQELSGVAFSDGRIEFDDARALLVGFDEDSLCDFELAIDIARQGFLDNLFHFFGMEAPKSLPGYSKYVDGHVLGLYMTDSTWKQQLPVVRKLIRALEANGY